jgi:hypothetical protein
MSERTNHSTAPTTPAAISPPPIQYPPRDLTGL